MSTWNELLEFVKSESNVDPSHPRHHVTDHVTNSPSSHLPAFNTDNLNIRLEDGTEFTVKKQTYQPVTFGRLQWADNLSNESLFRSLGAALMPDVENSELEVGASSGTNVETEKSSST